MPKYRLALWGLIVVCLSCFALVALVPPRPISRENHARIRVGMTEGQVEGILGGPAHQSRKIRTRFDIERNRNLPVNLTQKRWEGEGKSVTILVDEDGVVTDAAFYGDDWPEFPRWRVLVGGLLLGAVLALLGHLCQVHWVAQALAVSVLGGAVVPVVAGLGGGGGFGAYLAASLCWCFATLMALSRPRSAALFVVVFTGTAAAVNYWARTVAKVHGGGDVAVFWGMWAILMVLSLPLLVLGGLVGWYGRKAAKRQAGKEPPVAPGPPSDEGPLPLDTARHG